MRKRLPATIEFGSRVRRRRDELGWTQERLAEAAGLHPNYVASLERGERNVSLVNIVRLANALDLDGGALVDALPVPSSDRR